MKILSIALFSLMSLAAASAMADDGFCKNNEANPHFRGLCRQQGQIGGRDTCEMTNGCYWVSLDSPGVCVNDAQNPHFRSLCRQQGRIGGQDLCLSTRGCEWLEL